MKKLPAGIAELKGNEIELKSIEKLAVFESYLDSEKVDFIKVTKDQASMIFSFETDGALTAKDALRESAKILENKYKEFGKFLKNLK